MQPGNSQLIKKLNEKTVLNWIRKKDNISRSKLARLTSLNPSTISDIVSRLISNDLVIEKGRGNSTGGRKPRLLSLNKKNFLYCGVSVHLHLHAVIMNIEGEVLAKEDIKPANTKNLDVSTIIGVINDISKEIDIEINELRGIGVGVPGQVNKEKGIVEYAPQVEWENLSLKEMIENRFHVPVYIDNGMKAKALGESWFGAAKNIDDFVLLNIEEGIGSAIVINRKIYRGYTQRAGEVGHNFGRSKVDSQRVCRCGNMGCLETIASSRAIINSVEEKIKDNYNFPFEEVSLDNIFKAWFNNDEIIEGIIEKVTFNLGVSIADLFNILDPEKLIISGDVIKRGGKDFLEDIINTSKKHVFGDLNTSRIINSSLGKRGVAIGAATLRMYEYFESSLFDSDDEKVK